MSTGWEHVQHTRIRTAMHDCCVNSPHKVLISEMFISGSIVNETVSVLPTLGWIFPSGFNEVYVSVGMGIYFVSSVRVALSTQHAMLFSLMLFRLITPYIY